MKLLSLKKDKSKNFLGVFLQFPFSLLLQSFGCSSTFFCGAEEDEEELETAIASYDAGVAAYLENDAVASPFDKKDSISALMRHRQRVHTSFIDEYGATLASS